MDCDLSLDTLAKVHDGRSERGRPQGGGRFDWSQTWDEPVCKQTTHDQ
jgi:hypothetical protein